MSRKTVDLDFGPMSMPVGEDRRAEPAIRKPRAIDPAVAARFQARMQARDETAGQQGADGDFPSPFALLNTFAGARPPQPRDADGLADDIAYLWFAAGDGASEGQQLTAGLRKDVLPNTTVAMQETGHRLEISLTAADDATTRWLKAALFPLALVLSGRFERPLRLAIWEPGETHRPAAVTEWPEDFDGDERAVAPAFER